MALAAILPLFSGCGGKADQTPTHPAAGTVVRGGQPFGKAMVVFHPVNPQGKSPEDPAATARVAETDAEGRFTLSTYRADDGAPAGEYVVTVAPAPPVSSEDADIPPPAARPLPAALVRYGAATTSPLRYTVKDGENTFRIDLP